MIDVSLLVFLCATRFFLIRARMLFFSQNRSRYVIRISIKPRKFDVNTASPRIIPIKIRKKICKIRVAFSARRAYGSTM